jgi:hypothetical protein
VKAFGTSSVLEGTFENWVFEFFFELIYFYFLFFLFQENRKKVKRRMAEKLAACSKEEEEELPPELLCLVSLHLLAGGLCNLSCCMLIMAIKHLLHSTKSVSLD